MGSGPGLAKGDQNFQNIHTLIYYVYIVSFALAHYHIWITSCLVLNVIC